MTLPSSVAILVSGSVFIKRLIVPKFVLIAVMSLSAVVTRVARALTVVLSALFEVSTLIDAVFARMSPSAVLKSVSMLLMVVSMLAR